MRGISWAVLASFLFALMNASAKGLSERLSVPEIVFYRGLIGVGLTYFLSRSTGKALKVSNWPLVISRGLFGAASLLLSFLAISRIALADAAFLSHLAPLVTVVLGATVLQERMPKGFASAFSLALVGTVLVAQPWSLSLRTGFVAVGVLGACLAASASIAIRQLSKDHNDTTIMMAFLVTATVLPVPFLNLHHMSCPQGSEWPLLLFLGVVSFLGQYCLTRAYRQERAGLVATTRYIGVVFNIALGWLFWRETPQWTSLLGGVFIISASLWLAWLSEGEKTNNKNQDVAKGTSPHHGHVRHP